MNFHSDDFGYNEANDIELLKLIESDKLQSVSILATMVKSSSLKELKNLHKTKKFRVGLHFNIIEGKSLSPPELIPSLVSHKGTFFPLYHLFFNILSGRAEPTDIATELERQLTYLKEYDLPVSLIDSHQHTHALSPVAEVVMKVAEKHEIHDIRPYQHIKTHSMTAAVKYTVLKSMASLSHLATYDRFSLPASWTSESMQEYSFMSWESSSFDIIKKGSKNIWYVVHPGLGYDTNKTYESYFKSG